MSTKAVKVLIDDGMAVGTVGGIGSHTSELYARLQGMFPGPGGTAVTLTGRRLMRRLPRSARRAAYQASLQTCAPIGHRLAGFDLVHFANFHAPAWRPPGTKYIVTVHDLSAWEAPGLEPVPGWYWPYARWAMTRGIRSADGVIVRTVGAGQRLRDRFNIESAKVFVCPDGIRSEFTPAANPREREATVLVVGTMVRRKNAATAVRAFSIAAAVHRDLRLVLVGGRGSEWPEVERAIGDSDARERITVRHDASDDELLGLYRQAAALVMPSRYEGFGIPMIEAMACGLPVIASDIEVFREVGADAVRHFGAPGDAGALAATILGVLSDRATRDEMVRRGLERARQFTWDRVADRYVEIYESALGKKLVRGA
jgi:glycosyltransferase involved in cell wall biosynthesis